PGSSFGTSPGSSFGTSPGSSFGTSPGSSFGTLPRLSSQEKAYIQQIANYLLDNTNDLFLKFIDPENKLQHEFGYSDFQDQLQDNSKYVLDFKLQDISVTQDIDRLLLELNNLDKSYVSLLKLSGYVPDTCKTLVEAKRHIERNFKSSTFSSAALRPAHPRQADAGDFTRMSEEL
ncbi:hypothetical protein CL657_02295, partial [bacterium]|nr:hypothetical protein [bacterium]